MQEKEVIVYNGIKFTRYPNHPQAHHRLYYHPHGRDRKKGIKCLHQEVYKANHGPIPPGHDVHHKDLNALNNAPDNLEAIPEGDHSRLHNALRVGQSRICARCGVPFVDKGMRPARFCSDRCRWQHKEAHRVLQTRICAQCGTLYEVKPASPQRYCGDRCKALARAKERTCAQCSTVWTSRSLNPNTRFCSKKCHDTWTWQHRKDRQHGTG